jgi:hypothetical protein
MTAQTAAERVIKTGDASSSVDDEPQAYRSLCRGKRVKVELRCGTIRQVVIYRADLPVPTNIVSAAHPHRIDDPQDQDRDNGRGQGRRGPGGRSDVVASAHDLVELRSHRHSARAGGIGIVRISGHTARKVAAALVRFPEGAGGWPPCHIGGIDR